MNDRVDIIDTMLTVARILSWRSTCRRRTTGCVLTDSSNRILATGYNGGVAGEIHCLDVACPHASAPVGTPCEALHAEVNAVLQCSKREFVTRAYCTDAPCANCARVLLQLPNLTAVYYARWYNGGVHLLKQRLGTVEQRYFIPGDRLPQLVEQFERAREHFPPTTGGLSCTT